MPHLDTFRIPEHTNTHTHSLSRTNKKPASKTMLILSSVAIYSHLAKSWTQNENRKCRAFCFALAKWHFHSNVTKTQATQTKALCTTSPDFGFFSVVFICFYHSKLFDTVFVSQFLFFRFSLAWFGLVATHDIPSFSFHHWEAKICNPMNLYVMKMP